MGHGTKLYHSHGIVHRKKSNEPTHMIWYDIIPQDKDVFALTMKQFYVFVRSCSSHTFGIKLWEGSLTAYTEA